MAVVRLAGCPLHEEPRNASASGMRQSIPAPETTAVRASSRFPLLVASRMGMAFASEEIIEVMNKVKPPYNINEASQQLALQALQNIDQVNAWIKETLSERDKLVLQLKNYDFVLDIYPSDANFILVKTTDPRSIYNYLVERGIIVRDRSKVELCEGALRITIGTPEENVKLINALQSFK